MIGELMQLDIVSAEASIFSGKIRSLSVSGSNGELGIYPGHTALLTTLKPGQIKAIRKNGEEEIFYTSGGVLEVQPDCVTVLGDTTMRASDLDEAAASAAKQRAEKNLANTKAGMQHSQALKELSEAVAQLRAIESLRKRTRLS